MITFLLALKRNAPASEYTDTHMPTPEPITIDDLLAPRLSEIQRQALAFTEQQAPVELSVEAVLKAATEQTGLCDFGDSDFIERLRVWLQSTGEDLGLNQLGRSSVFHDCVRYAANRLKLEGLLRRHPEILDIEVRRPVIVAGLPRSGTTHLVNLLAADGRLSAVPYWEMREPVPAAHEPAPADHRQDPRYRRAQAAWLQLDATLPLLKNMHPMDPDHIHEELELENLDFSSYNLEWLARVPRWRDYYLAHDQTPHYRYMRKVLQAIQWQRGGQPRWVLKSPQHLEQLRPLAKTFPDATVLITHREPAAVVASIVTMLCYGDRLRRRQVDPEALVSYWSDRVELLLRSCVRDRDSLPEKQTLDIQFGDFMADQMGTVEQIFACAELSLSQRARQNLTGFVSENPRGKYGQIRYDLARDFGVQPDQLRARFRFYTDRFGLTR